MGAVALGELLPGGSSHDLGEEVDVDDEPAVEPLLLGCIESSKAARGRPCDDPKSHASPSGSGNELHLQKRIFLRRRRRLCG